MANLIIVGTQWGDEGKGKIVDLITEEFDVVVRSQGGHNAGHTVKLGEKQYILHLIPSGILHPNKSCVVGNGVVIDPKALLEELEMLREFNLEGRLFISNRAHLIMPYHTAFESAEEARLGDRKIGTTSRGIGPCYEDKMGRRGIRIGELGDPQLFRSKVEANVDFKNKILTNVYGVPSLNADEICESYLEMADVILGFVTDTAEYLNQQSKMGRKLLFEGAQGALLDIDHGTYPYVTSSNSTSGGACTGTGVGPSKIDSVVGISKAYTTRVGAGPFPTEFGAGLGEQIRERGAEYGASTGRPRRCGWFDAVVVRYSSMVNDVDDLVITKLDVLDELEEIKVCVSYRVGGKMVKDFPMTIEGLEDVEPVFESHPGWLSDTSRIRSYDDLPENAKSYLKRLSELTETEISIISVGPERDATILRETNTRFHQIFAS
jgi:adenylosuccinate synthase